MYYPESSTLDPHSEITKDVGRHSSVKRTPLQTISLNSPSLLARSRGSSKRRSPLYERFVKVSQSTPIYKSVQQHSTIKESKQIDVTPVSHSSLSTSVVRKDVNIHCNLSEVSLDTSDFSLEENISIPEVTSSVPSLGQIDMQYESFDIHKDFNHSNFSKENCSSCDQSFKSDNKENEYQLDNLYEDVSSDDEGDFLFHSRNSDSKIFLVPPIEDDLVIEPLDDVEVPSACQTWSSSQFGDNEESEEAAFLGNVTSEKDVNYAVEKQMAFTCSLKEIQDLIEKGMFLDYSTDDPTHFGDSSDGYIPVSLEAYEPEEGEADDTEGASALQFAYDDACDLSGESLSPGEIGSSLFSDNFSFSSSSHHSSSRKSSTNSSLERDLFKTSTDILQIQETESPEDSTSSSDSYEAMYCTSDTKSDDYEVNCTPSRMLTSGTTGKPPVDLRDYGNACNDQLAERGDASGCLTSSSACVQDGDPHLGLLVDLDLLHQGFGTASHARDDNWSLRVQTDSLIYQNEVDIWNCHAIQSDLVDYFGMSDGDLMKNDFTESVLRPENCSLQEQQDLKELSEIPNHPGQIFEIVDLENRDNDETDDKNVKEPTLDNSYGLMESVIESHSFNIVGVERIVDSSSETSDNDAHPSNVNHQHGSLNPSAGTDDPISNTDCQTVHTVSADNSPERGVCSLVPSCNGKADTENLVQASPCEENLGYVHSESSDDTNDDNDDDWEDISYDDEDCLYGFHSKVKIDDNFSNCSEDNTLIRDAKEESQRVEALKAVQQDGNERCKMSSQPEVLPCPQRTAFGHPIKWRCTIL